MKRTLLAALVAGSSILTSGSHAQLSLLNDEFNSSATLSNWQRIHSVEGWNADQLQTWNIDTSRTGWMRMVPHTSSWFANYRGVLAFKTVSGDFAVTTRVNTTNAAGTAAPGRQFSLAGIMIREPRPIANPAVDWAAGGENYVFLSHGTADSPGTYQYEVKTTEDSTSLLQISSAPTDTTEIRSVRIGGALIMLRRPEGGSWVVHRRYPRSDWDSVTTLQVGLTCYTDWTNVDGTDPFTHNSSPGFAGMPDLVADFDWVRYTEVSVPGAYSGLDLTDSGQVSDAQLLSFMGDALDTGPVPVELDLFVVH